MQYFFQLWYVQSWSWAWDRYLRFLKGFESQLAISTTIRNLDKPLFQDYTSQGRIIGFVLRIIRILLGLIIYLVLAIIGIGIFLAWLLLPALVIVSILGFFLADSPAQVTNNLYG